MSAAVLIAAAWNQATYGTIACRLTDDVVTGVALSLPSTGIFEHAASGYTGACAGAGASPTVTAFGGVIEAALNAASPTRLYIVSFDAGLYTITEDGGHTFSLAFTGSGAAGTRLQKLLGFVGDPHSETTYTSTMVPWFAIVPAKPGLVNYIQPKRMAGVTKSAQNDAGSPPYRLRPTSIPRLCSWEHHFEPKERVDADYLALSAVAAASTHYYSWERLWTDYGLAQVPIGMRVEFADGTIERLAFSLVTPEYDDSVCKRRASSDDVRFIITVKAQLWNTATADVFARSFA